MTLTWRSGLRWESDCSLSHPRSPVSTRWPRRTPPWSWIVTDPDLRGLPGEYVRRNRRSGHPTRPSSPCASSSVRSHHDRRPLAAPKCLVSFLSRDSLGCRPSVASHVSVHSPTRTEIRAVRFGGCHTAESCFALAVSHRLDVLLRSRACRLVASRKRPWDSLRFRLPGPPPPKW
jgi:hypothetical protein